MKSVYRIIRSYYEINGTFDGVEKLSILKDVTLSEDDLYKAIGFESKEEFDTRVEGIRNKPIVVPSFENENYIRLIAEYFRNADYLYVNYGNAIGQFSNLLKMASYKSKVSEVNALFKDAKFISALKQAAPKWEEADVENPTINLGILYTSHSLSIKDRNKINLNAAMEAAYNVLEIPLDIREAIISNVTTDIVTLAEKYPAQYKLLIDKSIQLSKPIAKLLDLCNINHIDTISQFQNFGCSVTPFTQSAVKIFTLESCDSQFVIVNNDTFKLLYERDLLKTLSWKGDVAYVTTNGLVPLFSLLGKNPGRDLR